MPLLGQVHRRIDARAEELRLEVPCLVHTDANFHNVIMGNDRATLVDWDHPGVRYPLEELEALEEHAYLNGVSALPAAFFAGYGRDVSRPLLRLHRIVACLGGFTSTEWSDLANDHSLPAELRTMISGWNTRLRDWMVHLEDHLIQT